jgi:hypothetical protein
VGAQVISRPKAHGHWVMTFDHYFTVENLATLEFKSHIPIQQRLTSEELGKDINGSAVFQSAQCMPSTAVSSNSYIYLK